MPIRCIVLFEIDIYSKNDILYNLVRVNSKQCCRTRLKLKLYLLTATIVVAFASAILIGWTVKLKKKEND